MQEYLKRILTLIISYMKNKKQNYLNVFNGVCNYKNINNFDYAFNIDNVGTGEYSIFNILFTS